MTTRRTKVLAAVTAALLAIGTPLAAQNGDPAGVPAGVIVTNVDPDGPAAAAGIERGDLILSIDGQDLGSARDLMQALADVEASEVTLSVKHGDDVRDQVVTIDHVWGRPRIGLAITGGNGANMDLLLDLGRRLSMEPMRGGGRFHVEIESDKPGVIVMEVAPESAAEAAGLQRGDWSTAVGDQTLDGAADQLAGIIGDHEPGDEVSIAYYRGKDAMTAAVTLGEHPESGAAMLGIRYRALPGMLPGMLPEMEDMKRAFEDMKERFERRGMRRWGGRADGDRGMGDQDTGGRDMDAGAL